MSKWEMKPAALWQQSSVTFKYSAYGALFGLLFPVFSTLGDILMQQLPFSVTSVVEVQTDAPLHWVIDTAPFFLGLFASLAGRRQDGLIKLNDKLDQRIQERDRAIEQLHILRATLEQRVADRTYDLETANKRQREYNRQLQETTRQSQRRVDLLQATVQVSRAAVQMHDLDELLTEVTRLINRHFGYYHIGVFMIDSIGRYAVLRAANSAGGKRMLARQHRLAVGSEGIVGFVTDSGQPRIAVDVGADAVFFDNPDLPDTRSEMALPLIAAGSVIGALDIQSIEEGAFHKEEIAVLTSLADQISVAIQNANYIQKTRQALREAQDTRRRYIRKEWSQRSQENWKVFSEYTQNGVVPIGDALSLTMEQVWREGKMVIAGADALQDDQHTVTSRAALAVPVNVKDEMIGVLEIEGDDDVKMWTPDEIALVQAVADQLGQALEGARLFEQTQATLAETEALFQISRSLAAAQQLDEIWQTVVEAAGRRRAEACCLFLFDSGEHATSQELVLVSEWKRNSQVPRLKTGTRLPLVGFSVLDTLDRDKPLLVEDLEQTDRVDDATVAFLTSLGFAAVLFQPVVARERWFGFLTVLHTTPHAFGGAEVSFFRTLADQAALALESQRLLSEAKQRAEREQLIRQITDKVRATSNLEAILETTVQELGRTMGLPRAFVRLGTLEELTGESED